MKINDKQLEYIKGYKFDAGYQFKILESFDNCSRIEKILELTKDKKIIHLGCCDHIPLIKTKIEKDRWLHKLLTENCKQVLGIDINSKAIEFIKKEIGYSNLEYFDICQRGNSNIEKENWDYIVIGEILEHIDNPVEFLKKIQDNYGEYIDKMIVTVPNILCKTRIDYSKKINGECINSDHRYWFTPYTLLKVANSSGLTEMELYFTNLYFNRWINIVSRVKNKINIITQRNIFKFKFYNFDTLILEAKLKKKEN